MTVGTGYADDLKHELLTEMAENFFSRRCRLEQRLEAFASLRDKVGRQGRAVLARWRQLRRLLGDDGLADRFFATLGLTSETLLTFSLDDVATPALRRPMALTAFGRYKKAVLACYAALRQDIEHYNEGGYQPDSRDPRRMVRIPGYTHLSEAADSLNAEIDEVNNCQCPSDVLHFSKSLDPARLEQEGACGCTLVDPSCRLDKDLAFTCIDTTCLGAPSVPMIPEPDEIHAALVSVAREVYDADPEAALASLEA